MKILNILSVIAILITMGACSYTGFKNNQDAVEVIDFDPLANYYSASDTLNLDMDLTGAIANGIAIPSDNASEKYFLIKFKVKNTGDQPKPFFYKVYYQNESYKFNEFSKGRLWFTHQNLKANDNFYGSWNVDDSGFHTTGIIPNDNQFHEITDSIKIVGNPRNEKKYFGEETRNVIENKRGIDNAAERIRASEEWYNQVKEKAAKNNIPVSKQLYLDAKWIAENSRDKGEFNNRWKRNPRAGVYNFMLVIAGEENLKKIPYYYKDVTIEDTIRKNYQNPFYYFLYDDASDAIAKTMVSGKKLRTKASINLSKGIYINPLKIKDRVNLLDTGEFCGFSDDLFFNANIEQFYHNINRNFFFENIPVTFDVVGDDYTQEMYWANTNKYDDKRLKDYIRITESPGKTIGYNTEKQAVFITTPGNEGHSELRKENVGVNTRIGFTYGKFRAKIQFPEMISNDYVWNGLTCAFWMIYQGGDWNMRDTCQAGYIPKSLSGDKKILVNAYSEIDIEIVKTSKYWPKSSYGNPDDYPVDDALNDNVIITCTNWDLACKDPKNFNVGVRETHFKDKVFKVHRWDHWYKALTSKYEYPQKSTLGGVFYYEIEWRPDKIIWRIGADKDHMEVIGYMDSDVTKIPNNQMVSVITQEFHHANWWPTAPFDQNNVPYPKNDITGYIYEITIE